MPGRPRRFQDVQALDRPAVRALLEQGDAVERVWAVWTLAMRATEGADELAARTSGEPNPGVRRALAVVLAGHGHLDLLVALARHDPDENVRASAMVLVVRQVEAGRVPWSVVIEQLGADVSTVRSAILGQLGPTSPADLRAAVVRRLEDNDPTTRMEAFEAMLRLDLTGDRGATAIRAWFERAGESERALVLSRWKRVADQEVIVRTIASASRDVRRHAIRLLDGQRWCDLAPLLEHDAALFVELWRTARLWEVALAELTLPFLVDVAERHDYPSHLVVEVARRVSGMESIDSGLAGRLLALEERCQPEIDALSRWEPDEDFDDEVSAGEFRDSLVEACRCLRAIAARST